jgi:hypothetical protein
MQADAIASLEPGGVKASGKLADCGAGLAGGDRAGWVGGVDVDLWIVLFERFINDALPGLLK